MCTYPAHLQAVLGLLKTCYGNLLPWLVKGSWPKRMYFRLCLPDNNSARLHEPHCVPEGVYVLPDEDDYLRTCAVCIFFFLTNLLTGRQDGRVSCLCAQVPMQRVSLGLASSFRLPVNILLFPLSFSHPFYCILSLSQRVDASICSRILRWPKRATCRPIQMTLPSYAAF